MPELEDRLTALAASIDWPPTPALKGRVLPVYGEVARSTGGAQKRRRTPRWTLVAAAALLIALLLAFTWLGLHTTIYRVPNPPTPSPHSPGVLGSNLGLGTATTLSAAQQKLSWKIVVPASLGRPDAVYLKLPPSGPSQGEVTLVYAHAPGIEPSAQTGVAVLVTEARGAVNELFFRKMVGPGTTVEQVSVKGHLSLWIAGHPHEVVFADADGNFYSEPLRLATNTLLFDNNGTVVRIEGDMTKAQALAIAGT